MNEQPNNTQAIFMEVTARKVETIEKKITAIEEKVINIHGNTELLHDLLTTMAALHADVKTNALQPETVQNLSAQLSQAFILLRDPVSNKVLHHHHIPKLAWISGGLFVALSLVCSGWYITSSRLDNFVANDTKYRQLRLDTSQRSLQTYLDRVDSLYGIMPDMRKSVLNKEEKYRVNFERLERAEQLKAEAKQLEKVAKEK